MAQVNSGGGIPYNFLALAPTVAQASQVSGFQPNHLEKLNAVVVPPNTSLPVPGHTMG